MDLESLTSAAKEGAKVISQISSKEQVVGLTVAVALVGGGIFIAGYIMPLSS
jgi:hypothetical protein